MLTSLHSFISVPQVLTRDLPLFGCPIPAGQAQLGLFETAADQPRRQHLMATLDELHVRFGRQTVRLPAAGAAKDAAGRPRASGWAGRAVHRAPHHGLTSGTFYRTTTGRASTALVPKARSV